MSVKRTPSAAPEIPGHDFMKLLGSGGFADVFLYEQALPARQVAVKVLLPDAVDRDLIEDFRQEANVMAKLSTHPSIVTVYGAAVSTDGRPYLSMEYCPKPNLGLRYRRERLMVPEVLQLGVQIAGAVETAHRAGVLHRDIKPANILVTAYNRPALTDFGIATTVGEHGGGAGMSIPWSPPEAFSEPSWSGRESDVFSLAATLFTLLAGRTPFEMPGLGNSSLDLITRIQQGAVAPLGRSDVSPTLASVLLSAMDVDPRRRHSSAMAFGRALQQVEVEMALPVTPLDVLDDAVEDGEVDEEDGGATRIRGIVSVDPHSGDAPRRLIGQVDESTVLRAPAPAVEGLPRAEPPATAPSKGRIAAFVSAGVLVVAAAVVGIIALTGGEQPMPADPSQTLEPQTATQPSMPIDVVGAIDGADATFTWVNPQPVDGDVYTYRYDSPTTGMATETVEDPTVTVEADPAGETCIMVAVTRATGATSEYAEACADA